MRALITALLCAALTLSALADDEHAAPGQSGGEHPAHGHDGGAHPEHAHTGDAHPGHGHAEGDHPAHGHDEHGHGHGHGHSGDAHPGHGHGHAGHEHKGHGHAGHFHRDIARECGCPVGWAGFKDHCFEYVEEKKAWIDAELHCQKLGGNLASVHTPAENTFLLAQIDQHHNETDTPKVWLGGSDAHKEGVWLWNDGTPLVYTNWNHGQPDDEAGLAHCLEMNVGEAEGWSDHTCHEAMPFFCRTERHQRH
ncbi:lactose-binding lectin l-2 isoform X2 [Amia ocellicauda]|uniref:lactose-binding lectin l-2 isoform X2 n=1 Tax=Amia ocellicauda TaxID=2972642 RepID=UPI0034648BAB